MNKVLFRNNIFDKRVIFSYLTIFFSCLFVFIEATDFYTPAYQGLRAGGDAAKYFAMSENTFAAVSNPFAFRVLSPFIVHQLNSLLHIALDYGWMLLTFLAIFASLIIFFRLLHRQLKIDLFISLIFTLLLSFTYYFSYYNFTDFWLVDPLNNLFIILGISLIFSENLAAFTLVLLAGFLNKETILLLIPLYLINLIIKKPLPVKKIILAVIYFVAVASIYLLFRMIAQKFIGSSVGYYFAGAEGRTFADNIKLSLNSNKDIYSIFHLLDFIWILFFISIYQIQRSLGLLNKYIVLPLLFLAILFFSRIFATDAQRVLAMGIPLIMMVSALAVESLKNHLNKTYLLLLTLAYLALNFNWLPKNFVVVTNLVLAFLIICYFEHSSRENQIKLTFKC